MNEQQLKLQGEDSFSHNTKLLPVWYNQMNHNKAKAAFLLGFTQDGFAITCSPDSLTKQDIVELLEIALKQLKGGATIIKP